MASFALSNLCRLTPRQTFLALALWSGFLVLSAQILQHGFGIVPCHMCLWQRYAHYAILAVALIGLLETPRPPTRPLLAAIILAALAGLAVALWQFAAQHNMLPWPPTCTGTGAQLVATSADLLATLNNTPIVPCDQETFTLGGLSLAGWNIGAMLIAIALSARGLSSKSI